MNFRTQTELGIALERIATKVETYSANSVANASDLSLIVCTYYKRETWSQTLEG